MAAEHDDGSIYSDLLKNLCYGGAAAALVVITQVLQVNPLSKALLTAIRALCFAMPAFLVVGVILDFTHSFREHYRIGRKVFRVLGFVMGCAVGALAMGIGFAILHLNTSAAVVYGVTCLVGFSLAMAFIMNVMRRVGRGWPR